MKWITTKQALAIGLLVAAGASQAEDIDLFHKIDLPGAKPNVLLVLDNAANFSADAGNCKYVDGTSPTLDGTAGGIEQCALYNVIDALPVDDDGNLNVNIGFMAYNANNIRDISDTYCGGSGAVGGCLLAPLSDNKKALQDWIKTWRTSGGAGPGYIKAVNEATGAAMQEAWAYFTGHTGLSGRKYAGVDAKCQKNYVIFIGNAFNNSGSPGDSDDVGTALASAPGVTAAQKALLSGSYKTTTCGTANFTSDTGLHENRGLYADEWARYMFEKNSLITYTVGLIDPSACKPEYPALLNIMAVVGGSNKYFETSDYAELAIALNKAVTEILAVNSVFASASLPVSVNTQGTFLNQVFIGMFRPDTSPRWSGNLKQYEFEASVDPISGGYALDLVDADGELAINSGTGFITQCARSFWTEKDVVDDYWKFNGSVAKGSCSTLTEWSNSPDGDVVEKGAAGFMLRKLDPTKRVVYTCDTGSCTSLIAFSASDDLSRWTRGEDVQDEDGDLKKDEMRPSTLGDVVHSRPVAVDYGGTTGVVVFYGANDGMLHALNGNKTGTGAGEEYWSFVAPEQYGGMQRLYDNSPLITFPSALGKPAKPYFFDGPVTAYQESGKVWIYASQRRGGRMVYAFDVSSPSSPQLMWRQGCTNPAMADTASCTSGYEGIAQTWSAPKPLKAAGYDSGVSPLLIMGGGYDPCEDAEPNTCTSPKGNKIYVMDAKTGDIQKSFTTIRSVAGDVTVVPNQYTGMADFAYAADTGGNVYRITFGSYAPADWTMTKIAALGCDTPTCATSGELNRKFLFAPEVVVVAPDFNAVLIGSGDREHPLPTNSATEVSNAFFMLRDKPWEANWLTDEKANEVCNEESLCLQSLWPISNTGPAPTLAQLDSKKGWYMALSDNEQVVTSAVVLFGETTFSTHMPTVPDPSSCGSTLGVARVYNIFYLSGTAVNASGPFAQIAGGGLPPSPVSGKVTVANPTTGQPMTVPFIIGASPESPVEVTLKTGSSGMAGSRERVYWYIQQ
jgi:type IV pilus assembly protein PilY1